MLCSVAQLGLTLCNPMDYSPPGSSIHGDFPGKNTRVGCHVLFQGILPTQGLNPGLPHCRWILYHLSHLRSPRTLERIAYPFSRGTSQPKNRTRVSCIADNSLPAELPGKPDFYNGFPQSDITLRHLFPTFQTTVDMCLAEPTHGSPKQQAL